MALQTSGAISISQIKTELGSSSNSLRALSAAAGKSAPDAMSEFYGYTSYTPPSYSSGASSISGSGTQSNPYIITIPISVSGANDIYQDDYFCYYNNEPYVGGPRILGIGAASGYRDIYFTSQTSGNQRAVMDVISANANMCTSGTTAIYAEFTSVLSGSAGYQGTGGAHTQAVNKAPITTSTSNLSVGQQIRLFTGGTQWYFEAWDYGCDGSWDEIWLDNPECNYNFYLNNFRISLYFESV